MGVPLSRKEAKEETLQKVRSSSSNVEVSSQEQYVKLLNQLNYRLIKVSIYVGALMS